VLLRYLPVIHTQMARELELAAMRLSRMPPRAAAPSASSGGVKSSAKSSTTTSPAVRACAIVPALC
jgi:hypothetical protein